MRLLLTLTLPHRFLFQTLNPHLLRLPPPCQVSLLVYHPTMRWPIPSQWFIAGDDAIGQEVGCDDATNCLQPSRAGYSRHAEHCSQGCSPCSTTGDPPAHQGAIFQVLIFNIQTKALEIGCEDRLRTHIRLLLKARTPPPPLLIVGVAG